MNLILIYSIKESGEKKYFFLRNMKYKSKNKENSQKLIRDILLYELNLDPSQIVDSIVDAQVFHFCISGERSTSGGHFINE